MKITIACPGRFHVGDLARELINLKHEISFQSIVPSGRLKHLGIPRSAQTCHLLAVLPWVLAQRKLRCSSQTREWLDLRIMRTLDSRYARIRDYGDVFIGMSGLCVKSLRSAKERGAMVVLERGSRHILSQKAILDQLPANQNGKIAVPDWIVERELEGYELADVISIPSKHVEESFVERGTLRTKLFRNPYGVGLEAFAPITGVRKEFDVIMTGAWSHQKGCGVLAEATLQILGLKLLHVGKIGDCPLPINPNFTHVDAVTQNELPGYYGRARLFAMPSEQEGLSMVQAQALASGLPIVGSSFSGSADLAELLGLAPPIIQTVKPGDPVELARAIQTALEWTKARSNSDQDLLGAHRDLLDWSAYGRRYHDFLVGEKLRS